MEHIGEKIRKIAKTISVILLILGFIMACISWGVAEEELYSIEDFEDFWACLSAFSETGSIYLGAATSVYCFGVLFGYLDYIVVLLEKIRFNAKNSENNQENDLNSAAVSNNEQDAAEELKRYKILKDKGAISEEEFQTKKEQLLNKL